VYAPPPHPHPHLAAEELDGVRVDALVAATAALPSAGCMGYPRALSRQGRGPAGRVRLRLQSMRGRSVGWRSRERTSKEESRPESKGWTPPGIWVCLEIHAGSGAVEQRSSRTHVCVSLTYQTLQAKPISVRARKGCEEGGGGQRRGIDSRRRGGRRGGTASARGRALQHAIQHEHYRALQHLDLSEVVKGPGKGAPLAAVTAHHLLRGLTKSALVQCATPCKAGSFQREQGRTGARRAPRRNGAQCRSSSPRGTAVRSPGCASCSAARRPHCPPDCSPAREPARWHTPKDQR
jgi:hypothetical protein